MTTRSISEAEGSKYKLILETLFQFSENWKPLMKMSEAVEAIWQNALSDLSPEEIMAGRDRCIRELKYPPKIKEFLDRTIPKDIAPELMRQQSDANADLIMKDLDQYHQQMSKLSDEDLPQRPPRGGLHAMPMPSHVRDEFRALFSRTKV